MRSNSRRRIEPISRNSVILEKPPQNTYINVPVYWLFFGARKSRGNHIKSAPSCSNGINGFGRVTRYSRKWAPEVPKNIYDYVGFLHVFLERWKWGAQNALFCCRFLGILGHPAAISVPNGPRARKLESCSNARLPI